jgi:hypothetical protein
MEKAVNPALMSLSVAAIVLGGVVLFFSITGLLKVLRESEVARLPAKAEQSVTLKEAGSYVLHVSHPRLDGSLDNASYSLRSSAGQEVKSSPSLVRTTVSGLSSVRMSVRNFEVEQPGMYRLSVSGASGDISRNELVFTRPYAAAMVARILGIVFGGICLMGGIVFTALLKAGKL